MVKSSQQQFLSDEAGNLVLTRYLVCGYLYQKDLGGLKIQFKKKMQGLLAKSPSGWMGPLCHVSKYALSWGGASFLRSYC